MPHISARASPQETCPSNPPHYRSPLTQCSDSVTENTPSMTADESIHWYRWSFCWS